MIRNRYEWSPRGTLVVLAALVAAAPVVVLAPFIFSAPVLIVSPFFLTDDIGKGPFEHGKTVLSDENWPLKSLPSRSYFEILVPHILCVEIESDATAQHRFRVL